MLDLLSIFAESMVAGTLAAVALSLLGGQIAARDQAVQTLCIGQGAVVGVLLGLGLNQLDPTFESHLAQQGLPFAISSFAAALLALASEFLSRRFSATRNSYFVGLFAVLLALSHLATALFPGLEPHLTSVFFGDLATLPAHQVRWVMAAAVSALAFLCLFWQQLTRRSFDRTVMNDLPASWLQTRPLDLWFGIVTILLICFCIQFLGLLFTLSALFIPTTIASTAMHQDLQKHFWASVWIAASGVIVGFFLSLAFTFLPTVPTIAATMFAFGCLYVLISFR